MSTKTKNYPDIGEVRYSKRKRQKNINIRINPGYTAVSMPWSTPLLIAEKFVLSKRDWIIKHKLPGQEFINGMGIGKQHKLVLSPLAKRASVRSGMVRVHPDGQVRSAILKALKQESQDLLSPMVDGLADITGLQPSSINYKPLKGRWGSCSSKQELVFNTLLIQLPWELIEYVVIHELCHILQMNHSPDFWAEVAQRCPDYKARKKAIKSYSPIIFDTSVPAQN